MLDIRREKDTALAYQILVVYLALQELKSRIPLKLKERLYSRSFFML
jgi:hypothetical protein